MKLENFERPALLWGQSKTDPNERRIVILEAAGGPPAFYHMLECDPVESWQPSEIGNGDESYMAFEKGVDQLPDGCRLPERYADLS